MSLSCALLHMKWVSEKTDEQGDSCVQSHCVCDHFGSVGSACGLLGLTKGDSTSH